MKTLRFRMITALVLMATLVHAQSEESDKSPFDILNRYGGYSQKYFGSR